MKTDEQKLKDILEKAGVYHSAMWYSGTGPNTRDLGADHLLKMPTKKTCASVVAGTES